MKKSIEYPNPEQNYNLPQSGCRKCQHLLTRGAQHSEEGWTCRAFPEGIPWEICMAVVGVDHTLPYPDDGGFRYTPVVFEFKGNRFKWRFDLSQADLVE